MVQSGPMTQRFTVSTVKPWRLTSGSRASRSFDVLAFGSAMYVKRTRRGSMQLLCELSDPIEPRDELVFAPDFDARMMC